MTFFTSDTHFHHKNIVKFSERPFRDLEEMHKQLIANWNSVVGRKDEVFHLGDFSLSNKPESWTSILDQLQGKIHLVKGNHDKDYVLKKIGGRFETITGIRELKLNKYKLVLCHYPLESWNRMHYGVGHLHGHCHGQLKTKHQWRMDVGVDVNNYTPVSLNTIISELNLPRLTDMQKGGR